MFWALVIRQNKNFAGRPRAEKKIVPVWIPSRNLMLVSVFLSLKQCFRIPLRYKVYAIKRSFLEVSFLLTLGFRPKCIVFSFQIEGKEKLTFTELHSRLKKFLTGFKHHGVLPGDRVVVNTDNTSDILVAIFTLMFHGAVVVFPGSKRTARENFNIHMELS